MTISPELLTAIDDDPVASIVELVELLDPSGSATLLSAIDELGERSDDIHVALLRQHLLPVDPDRRRRQTEFSVASTSEGGGITRQAVQQRCTLLTQRLAPVLDQASRHPIARHLSDLVADLCRVDDLPPWLRALPFAEPGTGGWGQPADVAQIIARAGLTDRRLTGPTGSDGSRWFTTDAADPTDRMHELADALTAAGESVVVERETLEQWLGSDGVGFRVGPRSIEAVIGAMIDDRVALRFADRFVVFAASIRTSTVERGDSPPRTRRRGTAIDRVRVARSLLPDLTEHELLGALEHQYGMTPNSIAVLRPELRRTPGG